MHKLPKWRLTPGAFFKLTLAIIFVLVSAFMSRAQEPDLDLDAEIEVVEFDPAVQVALDAINARNPEAPEDLIKAAGLMQQLGASAEAKPFLDQLIGKDLDDNAMAELHHRVDMATLVRIATDPVLMPEGRDFVHKVFAATRRVSRSPERMSRLITQLTTGDDERKSLTRREEAKGQAMQYREQLRSANEQNRDRARQRYDQALAVYRAEAFAIQQKADARRAIMDEIARAGSHAVPALLAAMLNPPANVEFATLAEALDRIGVDAEQPLLAALSGSNTGMQALAARALGRVGSEKARMPLIRPYFIGKGSVQKMAAQALRQLGGGLPSSPSESAAQLKHIAERHLVDGIPPVEAEYDGTLELWTWSTELNNVIANRLTAREAAAVAASRTARDAYELNPTPEYRRLLLASTLQSDQLLNGVDRELPKGPGSAYQIGKTDAPQVVRDVMRYALEHELDPAAIGAAELMGDIGQPVVGNSWGELSRALRSPNRRVRYAAAKAIMKVDPRHRYPGASLMLQTLIDLASASGQPRAIVATPRLDLRNSLSGIMGSLGFSVFQTGNSKTCVQEALRGPDYDVILLSDSVSDPIADETIQQIRRDPRGKRIPIVLLAREDRQRRTDVVARLHAFVSVMPEFGDEPALIERLRRLELEVADHSVPPTQRLVHAVDAIRWLSHLARYSKSYPFYDIMRSRDVAVRASVRPQLAVPATELLGSLGDETSQKALVDLASQGGLDIEQRQRAANAFSQAVLRRGLMLRSPAVRLQYDRYNASESANVETQEVLGQLLDVIETQTRPTSLETTP